MESFGILALLCLVYGFSIVNTNAQVSSRTLPSHDLKEIPDSVFLSPGGNYDELLKTPSDNGIRLTGESASATNPVTFNGKWERLTGKSLIDTSRIYYFPLKIANNPAIYDNQLYRRSATIFNMLMSVKYPYVKR
jgi:hypothetical protein